MSFRALCSYSSSLFCATAALVALASGCGPATASGPGSPSAEGLAIESSSGPAASADWACGGELVPPIGWEQQTSFEEVSTANARDVAMRKAMAALTRRLCAGASDCDFLNAHVAPWKTGTNGREMCAMAVVKKEHLDEWRTRATTLSSLDEGLDRAAKELAEVAGSRPRVGLAEVVDMGIPGGSRAEWLRSRMARALQRHAEIVDVPKGWSGSRAPQGFALVVRGSVVARSDRGIAMLEVVWDGVKPTASRVVATPVAFPESASPHAPVPPAPTLPREEGISVRLDSSRGGSLCAGERTQLWLESDRAVAVAVVNLYGTDGGLLTFPNEDVPSSLVPAAKTIALGGPQGFEAVPVPGSEEERFLVIAAPNEAALGAFRGKKGPCRVAPEKVREWSRGKGLPPGVRTASTGYRIVQDASCPAPPQSGQREGVVQAIASLPICAL
jgi:hypothetical protein